MSSSSVPPSGPPGVFPSSGQVGPPSSQPFGSYPLTRGPVMPPSSTTGPISNGPPAFGSGALQGGPPFPSAGSSSSQPPPPAVGPAPPAILSTAPHPASNMLSHLGSRPIGAPPGHMQPAAPFSAPSQGVPPPPGSSPFSGPPQGVSPPLGSPYGAQAWPMQPHQPTTSDYIVKDTGNCSPRYLRCTINQIPCTVDLLTSSGMQLALMVQPMALPHPSEEPIQVVDFGESGPVRCSRCKGYINPFVKFIDQGRRFICNFCGFTDETPRDYHCNLGPDGRRRDAEERPELCRGTVEFVATKEYMVRDPMPAVFFFLIDVSMNAIQTGATAAACSAINQVIADLPEGPRTMVGVATFDSTIHFYNLKRALQQPLMLIVPDVQDVYTPLQTDVIVQLSECRQHLVLLLENIPTMFQNNRTSDSAFGAAVKAAFLAMKSTGGKLLVFQSVLPSVGIGALSAREAEGRTNISAGEKEAHKLFQPADKILKTLAVELAEYQVCVDVFITTQSYVDIASISVIPRTTGGQVYYYYPFSALSDPAKLYNDLRWNITRPQGFEAVMRVRCSQGIQVQEYSGNFCKRIPTDVDLPAIDSDKTLMVTLKHDDKLQDGSECAFQCALLYTTVYGQRRIRVSTLSLPCTSLLSNLFRSADLDTQFACFLKQALVKSTGLRTDGRIDDRSFWISYVSSLCTSMAIPLVYPRMMAIHDLNSKDINESLLLPSIPLSSEHVCDDGVYLLENGEDCLVYVGNSVDPNIMQQLFGISSLDEVPAQFLLQLYDNPLSKKLNDVVNEIRRQRCSYLRLKLCKKGDSSGMLFYSYMVEDKTPNGLSYVEFLVHIHRQIQSKMP
ncbi:Protein transport protein Sec24-like [Camellia lanceoleosa]|uniref:Protein transport protein Sec24-like n=1 Tax=Camellia lanceoleosa TaxID=1840588 RepID=A0ACC0HX80_9ERIC|nr:Protein transport protein Sec24-like [Camellia lanceoleosa]